MKEKNSGQIRIIEAFLAVLIIFSSLTISANLAFTQNGTKHDDLASVGLQALTKLDSDGSLGRYIDQEDWTTLRNALNLILPAGVAFNLTIYNKQMQQINTDVISNAGFSSQDITFVEYLCANQGSNFHCYTIHLYLAVAT